MNADQLLKIKNQIEKAKQEASETKGKIKSTEEQMKKEFGVDTIEDAEKLLKEKDAELNLLEKEFEQAGSELEKAYSWN